MVRQQSSERSVRLRVLRAVDDTLEPMQNCAVCRNQQNCFAEGIKEEHVVTNMLVCRIKRGIEVNRAAKLFLRMVRPKLKTLAKFAIRDTHLDIDTTLADLESEVINYIIHHYLMGEIAYPLHRLFSPQNGHITFFANNYARKTRKYDEIHTLGDATDILARFATEDEGHSADAQLETDLTRRARDIVDDGITLTLQEYRVLRFCLSNASEAKRPLNGLHVYLAKTMGIPRARVTKTYADAVKRMAQEVQHSR